MQPRRGSIAQCIIQESFVMKQASDMEERREILDYEAFLNRMRVVRGWSTEKADKEWLLMKTPQGTRRTAKGQSIRRCAC